MIISRIQYGLGNQLFQYALGKRLAIERGQELKLDITWFDNNGIDPKIKIRDYSLVHFTIDEKFATKNEINAFRYFENDLLTKSKIKFKKWSGQYPGQGYILERGRHDGSSAYDEKQLINCPDVFLEGCWQSYDYFKNIDADLHEQLKFNITLDSYNQQILKQIQASEAVGMHIRKGDYLHPQFINTLGQVCSKQYYQKSMAEIAKRIPNPTYFIFSDDFEWVKENMDFGDNKVIFVDQNDQGMAHVDMYLLSNCNNMILSNSTFSWWAAWFNKNKARVIVSPTQWRMGGGTEHPGLDNWINID